MTDMRFPERWLNDRRIMRLTPPLFRAFVIATTYSVGNRTDGIITPDDAEFDLMPRGVTAAHLDALVDARLAERVEGGWLLVDFELAQSTKAQLEGAEQGRIAKREKDAERKRRERAHAAGDHRSCLPKNCPDAPREANTEAIASVTRHADVTDPSVTAPSSRGVTRDVTRTSRRDPQDRPGQARTGKALPPDHPDHEHLFGADGKCWQCDATDPEHSSSPLLDAVEAAHAGVTPDY